ncbi:hypothetical protein CAPTEDRAFT_65671, partial [Capitella teleta]
ERYLRKKLRVFLVDLMKFGCVKGFQYIVMYIRGREELIVSIPNGPIVSERTTLCSFNSNNLPYDKYNIDRSIHSFGSCFHFRRSLMLSQRTQRSLSRYGDVGVGLPPASPSEEESNTVIDSNATLFLLAAYGRYGSPYVWVRSNHDRIVRLTGKKDEDRDNPLRLKSTLNWREQDVQPWQIVAELVKLSMFPAPSNPFSVDFSYFENLPLNNRILASAAMIDVLHKVI